MERVRRSVILDRRGDAIVTLVGHHGSSSLLGDQVRQSFGRGLPPARPCVTPRSHQRDSVDRAPGPLAGPRSPPLHHGAAGLPDLGQGRVLDSHRNKTQEAY